MPVLLPLPPEAPVAPRLTLGETLDLVRTRRLSLVETSQGLRIRHRHRHTLPGIDAALLAYATPLRAWMRFGGTRAHIPDPWRAEGWDSATRLFAAWFGLLFEAPTAPVSLRPGETITDWRRFRAAVADRLALGPDAPGAGSLADMLVQLFIRYEPTSAATPRRHYPLAA